MVALLNYVGKKALHHCGNYCTCLKLCALSMLTSVYTYIYLYVMHHHVKVQTSQVPRAVARRMIIFGNGWVPLGHLTMYRQECHNAQHTRGYIESRKSNFSTYDNPGIYWSQKIYIYLWQIFCIRSNLDLLINVIVQCYAYLWILTSSNTSVYRLQIKEYEKV